jgi:hypothetical protein
VTSSRIAIRDAKCCRTGPPTHAQPLIAYIDQRVALLANRGSRLDEPPLKARSLPRVLPPALLANDRPRQLPLDDGELARIARQAANPLSPRLAANFTTRTLSQQR